LPGVGRNLQDHLWITGLCFEANRPLPAPNYNGAGSAGFWKSRSALDRPDLMVMPGQVPVVSHEIAARYPIPPERLRPLPVPGPAQEPRLLAPEGRGPRRPAGDPAQLPSGTGRRPGPGELRRVVPRHRLTAGIPRPDQALGRPNRTDEPGNNRRVRSPVVFEL